jgi:predicted DNA-binding transcriptional regulator AlpA
MQELPFSAKSTVASLATSEPSPAVPARVLNERDAAYYIGMSVSFLRQARMDGDRKNRSPGPPWVQLGSRRIGYLIDDLNAWLEARRSSKP